MAGNTGKYWYMTVTTVCVGCGRQHVERFRVTDRPKPEDARDRYEYIEELCYGCLV